MYLGIDFCILIFKLVIESVKYLLLLFLIMENTITKEKLEKYFDITKQALKKVEEAFPQYKVIGISAKQGTNVDQFYEELIKSA